MLYLTSASSVGVRGDRDPLDGGLTDFGASGWAIRSGIALALFTNGNRPEASVRRASHGCTI